MEFRSQNLTGLLLCGYIHGRANENIKSAIKIQNTARLSCKLTTMILMV